MDPDGELSFLSEGTELAGFRRDIYGRKKVADLKYNAKLGYDESAATPEQMYEYLLNKFAIDTETYDRYRAYQIVVIRYALYLSSYQKYIAIGIAEDVSDQTVAMIREHASELQGVEVSMIIRNIFPIFLVIPEKSLIRNMIPCMNRISPTTVVMWLVKQGLNR